MMMRAASTFDYRHADELARCVFRCDVAALRLMPPPLPGRDEVMRVPCKDAHGRSENGGARRAKAYETPLAYMFGMKKDDADDSAAMDPYCVLDVARALLERRGFVLQEDGALVGWQVFTNPDDSDEEVEICEEDNDLVSNMVLLRGEHDIDIDMLLKLLRAHGIRPQSPLLLMAALDEDPEDQFVSSEFRAWTLRASTTASRFHAIVCAFGNKKLDMSDRYARILLDDMALLRSRDTRSGGTLLHMAAALMDTDAPGGLWSQAIGHAPPFIRDHDGLLALDLAKTKGMRAAVREVMRREAARDAPRLRALARGRVGRKGSLLGRLPLDLFRRVVAEAIASAPFAHALLRGV